MNNGNGFLKITCNKINNSEVSCCIETEKGGVYSYLKINPLKHVTIWLYDKAINPHVHEFVKTKW